MPFEDISFKTPLTSEPSNDTKIAQHQRTSLFFSPTHPLCRAPRSKLRQPVDHHLYPIPQPQTSEYEGLGWILMVFLGGILSWWFMSNNPHKTGFLDSIPEKHPKQSGFFSLLRWDYGTLNSRLASLSIVVSVQKPRWKSVTRYVSNKIKVKRLEGVLSNELGRD